MNIKPRSEYIVMMISGTLVNIKSTYLLRKEELAPFKASLLQVTATESRSQLPSLPLDVLPNDLADEVLHHIEAIVDQLVQLLVEARVRLGVVGGVAAQKQEPRRGSLSVLAADGGFSAVDESASFLDDLGPVHFYRLVGVEGRVANGEGWARCSPGCCV